MANYSYLAINESGRDVTGTIEADSSEMAENMLLSQGLIPSRVTAARAVGGGGSVLAKFKEGLNKVKITDLILFTKQFRSMMQAGIPILRLFQVLENQSQHKVLKNAISVICRDIKAGATLHEAMKRHPALFSPLYLSMINAGEVSGTVPSILARLIDIIEHEAKIKADIKSALQYPMIVLFALGAAFFVLLTLVIPKFAVIFAKSGIEMPMPTQVAMWLYQALADYWPILIGGAVIAVFGLRSYIKTANGRYMVDAFFLKIPALGPLFQKAAMSRFASIFALLQGSGVPVMQALAILTETIGNKAISTEIDRVRVRVQEGQGIAGPLREAKYFTPMLVDMVAIGEESGNIEEMLSQVSIHYDDEVAYAVKTLSDLIGPVLMVGLAAVVGFFALAIFLPMWDMTKMVK
jgi:type II secretory pathway component PulF